MPLYPTSALILPQMQGINAIQSSSALLAPFTLMPGTAMQFSGSQLSPTQDYSIRLWMSVLPGGDFIPTIFSYWHLNRTADQLITPYDMSYPAPSGRYVIPVPLLPGDYYLNVLNLVNAENVFSFSSTELN